MPLQRKQRTHKDPPSSVDYHSEFFFLVISDLLQLSLLFDSRTADLKQQLQYDDTGLSSSDQSHYVSLVMV